MKKILSILSFLFMLGLSCIFFHAPFVADAASISGISGNKFVFTGKLANGEQHYFLDDNEKSTLVNAKLADNGGEYYSLQLSDNASGWGEIIPTSDMNELIKKGVVYVEASASVKGKKSSKINL